MKLTIAYGIPASGKTTLLKTLPGLYKDFDFPENRKNVKQYIESLQDGEHVVDFFLKAPNEFVEFFFSKFPNDFLTIYKFEPNRELSKIRDAGRRNKSSLNWIENMKIQEIKEHKNLTIKEVK